jgi:preprotein translocase subunit SecG
MTQKEWGQVTLISLIIGMWGAFLILLFLVVWFAIGYLKSEKKKSDEQERKKELEGLLQKYEKANERERRELIEKIDQLNKDK